MKTSLAPVILLFHVSVVFSSTFSPSSYQKGKSLTAFHKEGALCVPGVSVASVQGHVQEEGGTGQRWGSEDECVCHVGMCASPGVWSDCCCDQL